MVKTACLLAALAAGAVLGTASASPRTVPASPLGRVARVVDGDTVLLADGRRVRLVQVDTPEVFQRVDCYGRQAAAVTTLLLPVGTRVRLVSEPVAGNADRYGRLFRYVVRVRDGLDVNLRLVRLGAAAPYFFDGQRGRYAAELERLARSARDDKLGLWGRCALTPYDPDRAVRTAAATLQVGAYYYTWYSAAGRQWQGGYLRGALSPPQPPALGQYDSRDPATLQAHFDWAHQYGIDFFVCSWWGPGSYEDASIQNYLLRSPAIGDTKIALLYESIALLGLSADRHIVFDDAAEAKLISDFDYLARTAFADPHYLRVDGRPVVYLYVSRIYSGAYEKAIADLRATIRDRYGYDLYLVGDEVNWDGAPQPDHIRLFDAITSYTMYSPSQTPGWPAGTGLLPLIRGRYRAYKAAADAAGVGFIPDVLPSYNDRGFRLAADHHVLPPELGPGTDGRHTLFSRFLDLAAGFVDRAAPTVVVTSWNEWQEDTEIEPTATGSPASEPATLTGGYTYSPHGLALLEALQRFEARYAADAVG